MNRLLVSLLAAAALASCLPKAFPTGGMTRYNLDFEHRFRDAPTHFRWYAYALGYDLSADTTCFHHGRASLKIERKDSLSGEYAFLNQELAADAAGRDVCLTGWVRTEGLDGALAGIWIGGDDDADWDPADDWASPSVKGTSDWTQLTVRAHLSDTAKLIVAAIFMGEGTAWFDDFRVTIDGVPLVDSLVPAPKSVLTRAEKRSLKKYIYPLRTCDADGGSTEDLAVLNDLVGGAEVVALGETTHGSSEIFRMKDRLVRYLAGNAGFGIFTLEDDMAAGYNVGRYVAGGEGELQEALSGLYWMWNTEEMRDLVEWMRACNDPALRIAYTGMDMQMFYQELYTLLGAFGEEKPMYKLIGELARIFSAVNEARSDPFVITPPQMLAAAEPLLVQLEQRVTALSDEEAEAFSVPAGGSGRAWLLQNIVLLRQYLAGVPDRDRFMAENLLWIRGRNPGTPIVVWAHNGHICKTDGLMGGYLRDSLGEGYVNFGFAFAEGVCSYIGDRGIGSYEAQPAYPGTLEYLLAQLDEPIFVLDLKKMREADDPALKWIDAMEFRVIGYLKAMREFYPERVSEAFDYLIFIRESTPSHLLGQNDGTNS